MSLLRRLAMPQLPGVISGFGGGTYGLDGRQVTAPDGSIVGDIPGYPPPEAYPIGNPRGYQPSGPDMTPEPQQVATPLPDVQGPSVPVPASEAPHKRRHGILGALESVFAPEPGSFWWSALNNGLFNAKQGQQQYRQQQNANALALRTAEAKARRSEQQGEYQIAGNNIFHIKPDGTYEIIQPPQNPGEQERLLNRYMDTSTPPDVREIIRYMLKGVQYTPQVLQAREQAKVGPAAAIAESRAAATERHRAKPAAKGGRTTRRRSAGGLPAGFVLD